MESLTIDYTKVPVYRVVIVYCRVSKAGLVYPVPVGYTPATTTTTKKEETNND